MTERPALSKSQYCSKLSAPGILQAMPMIAMSCSGTSWYFSWVATFGGADFSASGLDVSSGAIALVLIFTE